MCSSVRRVRGQIDSNVDAREMDNYRVDNSVLLVYNRCKVVKRRRAFEVLKCFCDL